MATLTNTKIKDTYDGLLKTTDNDVIGASEKVITDGLGNASVLSIGTDSASFSSDIEVNGLTIGLGSGDIDTNTALGLDALLANTSGSGNVSVGQGSLRTNTTGSTLVAVGKDALRSNTTGGSNTAIGYYSLYSNTTGQYNVAIGSEALIDNTTASNNLAIGYRSLYNTTTGGLNIAVGNNSLQLNTTGLYNVALGHSALYSNETGGSNVALGYRALFQNTGSNNTAVGSEALDANTTGENNVAVGRSSLGVNTTGSYNLAVGSQSLDANTTGASNTAVGHNSLGANTTGINNTVVGVNALELSVDGIYNVALGHGAGSNKTGGDSNVYIGYNAIGGSTTSSNEIVIGKSATGNGSNTATYGNSSITNHYFTSGAVRIDSNSLQLVGDSNPTIYVNDTTNNVGVGLKALVASTKIDSSHTFNIEIGNDIIQSVSSSGVDITGRLAVDTDTLYVDASNNRVGIGTTPSYKLHISGSSADTVRYDNGTNFLHNFIDVTGVYFNTDASSFRFLLNSGVTEAMRIDSSGNVGIGTSSPSSFSNYSTLTVNGTNGGIINLKVAETETARLQAFSGAFNIAAKGASTSLLFETNGSERMRITSGGYLKVSNTGTYTNASGGWNEFYQTGTSTALALRCTNSIFADTVISIEADRNTTNNSFYAISYYNYGGSNYRFRVADSGNVTNTNNSYGAISDAKLKENVTDASPKLDDLMQIRVRNYNLIGDDKKQLGVVAQELEEVFPSMIDESPDFEEQEVIDEEGNVTKERVDLGTTTKSVKYSVFVPMLIKAMQEQQEIINDLKARIETLENN